MRNRLVAFVLGGLVAPLCVWGGTLQGDTAGQTATGTGVDDYNTSTTINAIFVSDPSWLLTVASEAYPSYDFVTAASVALTDVDPGDFSISGYNPWVVNNNATTNYATAPSGSSYNRGITGQDAGGANIVISYTPLNGGDPTDVNFLQGYVEVTNGGPQTSGAVDNGGASGPFYNQTGVSGTGTSNTSSIPLVSNATTPAWMLDIPYTCESGLTSNADCTGGVDDAVTSESVTFLAFITAPEVIDGTDYNVLFGGVEWGYSYSTVDTPEPSSMFLLVGLLGGAWCYRRRRMGRA